VPNAQDGLKRIGYRMEFEDDMRAYLSELDGKKPVIYTGDLNVAHEEIDLKNPKSNIGNPGFSYEERGKFTELLGAGFIDSFRELHPEEEKYSWWSYRFRAREKNIGWRIDYFVTSARLLERIKASEIHTDVFGSDHCPVSLEIDI
jgi:exodeoxyribonuclease-3